MAELPAFEIITPLTKNSLLHLNRAPLSCHHRFRPFPAFHLISPFAHNLSIHVRSSVLVGPHFSSAVLFGSTQIQLEA